MNKIKDTEEEPEKCICVGALAPFPPKSEFACTDSL